RHHTPPASPTKALAEAETAKSINGYENLVRAARLTDPSPVDAGPVAQQAERSERVIGEEGVVAVQSGVPGGAFVFVRRRIVTVQRA
ncbi:hypothetical protein, partial [Streptomyces sp. NPDC058240]|uniref:hypothetical protein n=1 Tax=Streptomyces sp. NPDC058240 TaxID=3346396 RepID=UPI0036F1590F